MLNFAVPGEVVERLVPRGTAPDLFEGQSYISIVGFWFHETRVLGLSIPGHTRFQEVNLRYYVRREANGQVRRGVVFAREIVPRRAIALAANWLYGESYEARPMESLVRNADSGLLAGTRVEYRWQTTNGSSRQWNRVGGCVASRPIHPGQGTIEEFIVEHYWGYTHDGRGGTREYRVEHVPWKVAPLGDVVWDCDERASFGATPLSAFLAAPPASAFVADGSPVAVYFGRRIETP